MAGKNDTNLYGALAYLLGIITGILLYLAKPNDKYVRYHATQSILLTIVVWVIFMVVGALVGILGLATLGLGFILGAGIIGILNIIFLLLWIYCMWKAYSGEKFKLPVIGDIAAKHVAYD